MLSIFSPAQTLAIFVSAHRIGFTVARRLAQDGAQVVVSSQKQQNGLSVTGTVCHVGKVKDWERRVATTLDINVKAPALMTKAVVPEMEKRGSGSVRFLASVAAFRPLPGFSPYNVSKTALLGLTKTLAIELAPRNVRLNCLAPGLIKTSFSRMLWMDKEKEESMKETLQIRRLGEPEDCAGIVSFLCSEDASYITEETVVVGGGTPSRL
uniref:DHRS4 n=1 Tax=Pongo abelii TaxID=9601 RepID=A0A8I5U2R4_PONAB